MDVHTHHCVPCTLRTLPVHPTYPCAGLEALKLKLRDIVTAADAPRGIRELHDVMTHHHGPGDQDEDARDGSRHSGRQGGAGGGGSGPGGQRGGGASGGLEMDRWGHGRVGG